jgi:hypothetical protein
MKKPNSASDEKDFVPWWKRNIGAAVEIASLSTVP